jgi:hypothetical protein
LSVPEFTMAGIEEMRCTLTSAKNLPLPNGFEASPDQPVRFTGVGSIKAIVPRRNGQGVWSVTYEVETVEVEVTPL